MKNTFVTIACAIGLMACAAADGPSTSDILNNAERDNIPVLQIDNTVVQALGRHHNTRGLVSLSTESYTPGIIKPGDTIGVTLFDTGESGMFEVGSSGSLPLGEYVVSPSGTVDLPFAGGLNIGGRSAAAAQAIITRKLRENSVNPSASVNIARKESDSFSVLGSVAAAGVFPLTAAGERVLQGVAQAGGPEGSPENTLVTVIRSGSQASQVLSDVIAQPNANIALLPGDTVIVGGGEANFIADGALAATGEFDFVEGSLDLSRAIAMAGGLQNSRANPKSIFVFRRLEQGEGFILQDDEGNRRAITEDVIFRANYRDPAEILRAGKFMMQDGDVLYVGDAPLASFSKFFQVFSRPPEVPAPPRP